MNVLISRILRYLNGTIVYDDYYKFCEYVIFHYLQMENTTAADIARNAGIAEESIMTFIGRLGYDTYEDFLSVLIRNHEVRLDQIRARMLGINSEELIANMEKSCSDEEMNQYISTICEDIDKAEKIFIIGAYYPLSLAIELQTDLITFGKPVYFYHAFDPVMHATEKDVVIFISATGRAMNGFLKKNTHFGLDKATSILITQNPVYEMEGHRISNYVLRLPGKFDGINFNYQIMTICDLIRVHYYQQYYL